MEKTSPSAVHLTPLHAQASRKTPSLSRKHVLSSRSPMRISINVCCGNESLSGRPRTSGSMRRKQDGNIFVEIMKLLQHMDSIDCLFVHPYTVDAEGAIFPQQDEASERFTRSPEKGLFPHQITQKTSGSSSTSRSMPPLHNGRSERPSQDEASIHMKTIWLNQCSAYLHGRLPFPSSPVAHGSPDSWKTTLRETISPNVCFFCASVER